MKFMHTKTRHAYMRVSSGKKPVESNKRYKDYKPCMSTNLPVMIS